MNQCNQIRGRARMNYELTEEEVKTIVDCVKDAIETYTIYASRIDGKGSARARQDALIKVRNCNDVLRTLSEEVQWDTKDGAGIL